MAEVKRASRPGFTSASHELERLTWWATALSDPHPPSFPANLRLSHIRNHSDFTSRHPPATLQAGGKGTGQQW